MGSQGKTEHILVTVDAATYNVRKATCGGQCWFCDGVSYSWIDIYNFGVGAYGGQTQESFYGMWDDSSQNDYTSLSSWYSDNSSIMTVNTGMVTGQSPGTANVSTYTDNEPIYNPNFCCLTCLYCDTGVGASSPGTTVIPDHIAVVSDQTSAYLCSIGTSRTRTVNYNVIANNSSVINRPISVFETVDPSTYSSCDGGQVQTSYSCTPISNGNYTDGLDPGCPGTSQLAQGCGFVFPDQVWKWCNPLGGTVSLGDIGTDTVDNNSISLGGNTEGFPAGQTFPH
jgi:hypothetical protein